MTLAPLIKAAAEKHGIEAKVLGCLVLHESSANPWAVEFEQNFYNQYLSTKPRSDFKGFVPSGQPTFKTEIIDRSHSYGLCQLMGETAREIGFRGQYLTELCDPATNLEFGAKYFAACLVEKNGDVNQALLRYNGGSDESYPSAVLAFMDSRALEDLLYEQTI